MERLTQRRMAALMLVGLAVGTAQAACRTVPDDSRWLVKVEHLSTYPAGPEWNARITVFEDGCLVMEAPTALRVGGGRTEAEIPEIHLEGITLSSTFTVAGQTFAVFGSGFEDATE